MNRRPPSGGDSLLGKVVGACLTNRLPLFLAVAGIVLWGYSAAPFDWNLGGIPRDPVPVDAIPDLGENQQIVFTDWPGRSPRDVEDQVTYPLTVSLLGLPGVKTVRSFSFFGFSSVYVIFEEGVDFYWSRSRILEKLASLPRGTLPEDVRPALGPDATGLGQVYWYTLEGRDEEGNPAGGWGLEELRSIQDFLVRYALASADGVSEVASVGGHVREYQIDVDPDAMRSRGIALQDVFRAVKRSNVDVGARTIEVNRVEYVVRGTGLLQDIPEIESTVVKSVGNVPVTIADIARVTTGPAMRRGALDKNGAEAVGGVVVVRTGENPMEVISNIHRKVEEISPGLPSKTLPDGTVSHVTIVPFYDRTGLIHETLGTLGTALEEEALVTIVVVMVMVAHLATSLLVSLVLPLAVLLAFIAMRVGGVDANIVALSGIAIAIGTIVDVGIVIAENILRRLREAEPDEDRVAVIRSATSEVGSAVLTAVFTTVAGFLPVFAMEGPEGKLFRPLAWTKTATLIASIVVALTVLPAIARTLHARRKPVRGAKWLPAAAALLAGVLVARGVSVTAGSLLVLAGGVGLFRDRLPARLRTRAGGTVNAMVVAAVVVLLAGRWLPLGPEPGFARNLVFVAALLFGWLGLFRAFARHYESVLRWCLGHKAYFLAAPVFLVLLGATIWRGWEGTAGIIPSGMNRLHLPGDTLRETRLWRSAIEAFPGLGREFMPDLDEGSFLYMPTTMPHASIGEAMDVLAKLDLAISAVPEVESAVGKIGRVESALDPAPVSMVEMVVNLKSEYATDAAGTRLRFRWDDEAAEFARDERGELVPDPRGRVFRQWRDDTHSSGDIWDAIVAAGRIPGTTSAPRLQPIAARIVMLQSGMRAPMGIKIRGPDLETLERVGLDLERILQTVPGVEPATVLADRMVGKPYLEINVDREAIARHGILVRDVQDVIEVAVGGRRATTMIEGRERYAVRIRYLRELRDTIESLGRILVPTPSGAHIPLEELSDMVYVRGPQVIKSEETFLVAYVTFDKKAGLAEIDVVEEARTRLAVAVESGELIVPAGVSWTFAGNYENQIRSEKKLRVILPIALGIIFLLLHFQFRSMATTALVFSGVLVAWSGGFLMIWLYGRPEFLDFSVFGVSMRDLFQIHPINLSVAVWVGFLALFGIATDDGVIMSTYLTSEFRREPPKTPEEVRDATVRAGLRRIRPCLMTAATTILALLPVLTSTGRGADVMIPMAIPSFGGMTVQLITLLIVPTVWCWMHERKLRRSFPAPEGEVE